MYKIISFACFLGLIFSCGNNPGNSSSQLENFDVTQLDTLTDEFLISTLKGEDVISEGLLVQLDGKSQRISGNTGCNSFSSTYEIEEETINFSPPISTKKYCEGKMEHENTIGEILPEIVRVKRNGEDLVFLSEDNEVLLGLKKTKSSE